MTRYRLLVFCVLTVAALFAYACGSGDDGAGDSDDDNNGDDDDDNDVGDDDDTAGDDDDDTDVGPAELEGAAQKGPFIVGSSVSVAAIDAELDPTGDVFTTETVSDLGDFSVTFDYRGLVSIEAEGYSFNEVFGELSGAPLTLRAFYSVDHGGPQTAYVNVFTHLSNKRVRTLVTQGVELEDAVDEAEDELRAAVDVGPSDFDPGVNGIGLNILGDDNDANAYLFAVSAVLIQAAVDREGFVASVDSTLQLILNSVSDDLADDGLIATDLTEEFVEAQRNLSADDVMDNLADYLEGLGRPGDVPNLHRVLDRDEDDIADYYDNCPDDPNPGQEDDDGDHIGNHCDDDCPDDGLWCNGAEFRNHQTGECESAGNPCPIDDELFCNGEATAECFEDADTCGHTGDPCTGPGEVCCEDNFPAPVCNTAPQIYEIQYLVDGDREYPPIRVHQGEILEIWFAFDDAECNHTEGEMWVRFSGGDWYLIDLSERGISCTHNPEIGMVFTPPPPIGEYSFEVYLVDECGLAGDTAEGGFEMIP